MKFSEQVEILKPIAKKHGLDLTRLKEFHMAYRIYLATKPKIADELFMKMVLMQKDSNYSGKNKERKEFKAMILN